LKNAKATKTFFDFPQVEESFSKSIPYINAGLPRNPYQIGDFGVRWYDAKKITKKSVFSIL
jgi:hypothetical protein